jgi:hypothetical protein
MRRHRRKPVPVIKESFGNSLDIAANVQRDEDQRFRDAAGAELADIVFGPDVRRRFDDAGRDIDCSFGAPEKAPSPTVVTQTEDALRKIDDLIRRQGLIVPKSAPSTGDTSFSSQNRPFQEAIRPGSAAPPSYGATGGGTVLPTVAAAPGVGVVRVRDVVPAGSVSKGGVLGGAPLPPILHRGFSMAQLAEAARADIAKAMLRGVAEHDAKVAKASTAPARPRTKVEIIWKAGS